jgi:diguanylate cyclase (GGDEF)-like protein
MANTWFNKAPKRAVTHSAKSQLAHSFQIRPIFLDKINQSLTTLAYKQARFGFYTAIVCATVIWFSLHNDISEKYLNSWFVLIIGITILRAVLVKLFERKSNPEANITQWRTIFIISTTLGGVCWGLVSFVLLPNTGMSHQLLILLILAGITSGAVAFIAGILAAAYLYLVCALAPLIVFYLVLESRPDYLMALAIIIYLGFLMVQSRRINNMLHNGLLLQFELNEAKSQLEVTATHDALTKIANRHLFHTKFTEAIEKAKRKNGKVALLYLDLNKFKSINDRYGHHTGDKALLVFVERLKSVFKETHTIARLGGDEFAVIVDDIIQDSDVKTIVTQAQAMLEKPATINDQQLDVCASIGYSIFPTDGQDVETLLKIADDAMYRAKKSLA